MPQSMSAPQLQRAVEESNDEGSSKTLTRRESSRGDKVALSRTSWNPATNPSSKLVPSVVHPSAAPQATAVKADLHYARAHGQCGSPDVRNRSCSPAAPHSPCPSGRKATGQAATFARKSAPAASGKPAHADDQPTHLSVTAKTLHLLSMQTACMDVQSPTNSSSSPHPKTPTISEGSWKIASKRSRLSESSSAEVDLKQRKPQPQPQQPTVTVVTGGACNAPRPSPSSSRSPGSKRLERPLHHQEAPRAPALQDPAVPRELRRLIATLEAPSRLDFTSLRCKYSAAAVPAH